ncbi:Fe-S protein assembly co-chaperone HscB [Daejeonella sp. JGW-45]|uniref:Fe-S protein assembly co-chaperone HscB n=1 Tax=Daejeonella sp. JGW-45 TaxID=3034148 RepID=UPI0023EAC0A8|nr:Fe-S protein assembly co-chaperone HscB [Daejeonella sp. JGW-45]
MLEKSYFEFYDLPVTFQLDESQLKKKFYAFSKEYHPDFYANESQEKQDEVMELSTLNNKAYKVLSDPLKRIEYVLELHEMLTEGDKYTLPQEFLMDMMDVNEALMDMEFDPDPARLMELTSEVDQLEASLFDELKKLTDEFDAKNNSDPNGILLKIKDIWYRQKYLQRIRTSIDKLRNKN